MFSPNLEWPGDPQAAGFVGPVGSWLNEGVSICCSVAFLCVSQEIRDRREEMKDVVQKSSRDTAEEKERRE